MKGLLVFLLLAFSAHAQDCSRELASSNDATTGYLAYLDLLVEQGILVDADVARVITSPLANPLRNERGTATLIHARELESYLRSGTLDPAILRDWASAKTKSDESTRAARALSSRLTQHRQIHFVRYKLGDTGFELEFMDTPVTQAQWLEVMGENPSRFKAGDLPNFDHPVENITWYSAAIFANRLSERAGLEPYYDFSAFGCEGRAESGQLKITKDSQRCHEHFAQKSERGEGYRLPAESEFLPVLFPATGKNFESRLALERHAWLGTNSDFQTHAVAELEPLPGLDGEIYDLYGNVHEWSMDWQPYASDGEEEVYVYVNGGGFRSGSSVYPVSLAIRPPGTPEPDIGFRLVRTVSLPRAR